MSTDGVYSQKIPEFPGAGRLGRHIQHDPRSRGYAYDTAGLSVTPVRHIRNVPVFDQGDLGSCTGNAAVGAVATDPLFAALPATHPLLDEFLAVKTYSLATALDEDPDQYPPIDSGSTGLAAVKALQEQGLIIGYQHTFAFAEFLKALSVTTVMLGLNWYTSFDRPVNGRVRITKSATVRGGHEVYADEITADNWVGFTNSWSTAWGVQGRFYLSFTDVERLLSEEGDVTVPIPAGSPAPPAGPCGPTGPVTPASPDDVALYAAVQAWAHTKGLS